jgi:hypothetical protein
MPLCIATGPILNMTERQPIGTHHDEINARQQQMLNGQYIKMAVNGASMISGF